MYTLIAVITFLRFGLNEIKKVNCSQLMKIKPAQFIAKPYKLMGTN